jgi:hypothetical protein
MDEMKFKEEDKKKFIEFLNLIAKYAEFKMNTEELIKYFKLLNHMQTVILKKIDSNILEIIGVHESDENKVDGKKE